MNKAILICLCLLLTTGCASVMNDVTHPMKLETKTLSGDVITGADCLITNDYGEIKAKSGEKVNVRRSAKELEIKCNHPGNPEAVGYAVSRVNGSVFGNIILGGGIGAIVDHNRGTAYTYPLWIQMIFGKTLVFDRKEEKEGMPVTGLDQSTGKAVSN